MLRLDSVPESVARLLDRLASHHALKHFALGGGTSLALRSGHHLSVDLVYFTTREFLPQELFDALDLPNSNTLSLSKYTLTLVFDGVKIDLLRHAYAEVAPIEKFAGHRLISIPDPAAMKLNAIANRGSKKDFYDLAELLDHHSLSEMLGFFSLKYPATDPFAVIRSLAWFEDAGREPDPIPLVGRDWATVRQRMIDAVRDL